MISRRQFLAAAVAAGASGSAGARELPPVSEILFDPALPVLGNPHGDVTIAEFFDYACPYCKVVHPHLKDIVQEDGNIRLVMKDWPINGELAAYASRMVLAADRLGVYAPAHAAVMEIEGGLTIRGISGAMRGKGIDVGAIRDALDVHLTEIDALLVRNQQQARGLSLPGTPAFIVGSNLYRQPLSPEEIRRAIARARSNR
ncbi:DsbA family protein [Borborobacter arsenicus]|uniref:DsbA family protein n=1 Tax=Borborobacter arsenicus TaxID=1851146 RepID=UPI00140551A5|nr:DsbA family protein [Pseudaminobacter arsenicus]